MAEQDNLPGWFDPARHIDTGRGVYERETGLALAGDGLPAAGLLRARALAAAGVASDPLDIVTDEMIGAETPPAAKPAGARKAKQEDSDAQ